MAEAISQGSIEIICPPTSYVTISQLEYEMLIRANVTLEIVQDIIAKEDDYANITQLKTILGVTENEKK